MNATQKDSATYNSLLYNFLFLDSVETVDTEPMDTQD